MKNLRKYITYVSLSLGVVLVSTSGCNKELDIIPTDKLPVDYVLTSAPGIKAFIGNLYLRAPIEDFNYYPGTGGNQGYNYNGSNPNNGGQIASFHTDESAHTQNNWGNNDGSYDNWEYCYKYGRDVNFLLESVPAITVLNAADKDRLTAEGHFLRAFNYFALARRYGGVPIIKNVQVYAGDVEAVKVPRSTEKETWDFILAECDLAIAGLPTEWTATGLGASAYQNGNERRATKWAAYALKSRAALHAASIAKFSSTVIFNATNPAVIGKFVGMDVAAANGYYDQCIKASDAIMTSGRFGLYQPTPATPADATANIIKLFNDPIVAQSGPGMEAIFVKGYVTQGDNLGTNYDLWFQSKQTTNGYGDCGRANPQLYLADAYEDYTKPGQDATINTRTDNNTTDYGGYKAANPYIRYDKPMDAFVNKDARLFATMILPYSAFKGKTIIIQAGFIRPDGTATINNTVNAQIVANGNTYYSYGAAAVTDFSGFFNASDTYTFSGFLLRKFMSETNNPKPWSQGFTDWMEFRYAEVLLNYAEAFNESGLGDATKALNALNATRRRAGHLTQIAVNTLNVARERQVEMSFENTRYWDLIRRREYHILFNNNLQHIMQPLLDLRVNPAKYIMVRATRGSNRTFGIGKYYKQIPGTGTNGLPQNPNN